MVNEISSLITYFLAQQDSKLLLTGSVKPAKCKWPYNIQDDFFKVLVEIWTELNYKENPKKKLSDCQVGRIPLSF